LDRLTEAGKGASVFLSSKAEVDALFGPRFSSLVETVATNVRFKLELPPSLRLRAFYGEEASTRRENVQALHYFSGTEQMYLANLEKMSPPQATDYVRLTIEYEDPETADARTSEFAWRADELEMATGSKSRFATRNLNKARMVATFGYQLEHMARHFSDLLLPGGEPSWTVVGQVRSDQAALAEPTEASRRRLQAVTHCRRVKGRLDSFSAQLGGESEAARIASLWHSYCERYEKVAEPDLLAHLGLGQETGPKETKLVELKGATIEQNGVIRLNEFAPEEEVF
jgi:hypothetical protein